MEILTIFLLLLILLLFGGKVALLSGKVNRLDAAVRRLQVARTSDEKTVDKQHVQAPPRPAVSVPQQRVRTPSRTREEWEALLGGKVMNLVGAIAIILGAGFFLKYAFDNNWLNEIMRIVIGGVAGLLLIGGGIRLHGRGVPIFAQGLIGTGIAILYLTVYAAFDFYALVPQIVAFCLMIGVTAGAFYLALYYNAAAISFLAWAGGFLTPFLLNTETVNTVGLFTYITLLNIGLIGILLKKRHWGVLELLTIGATYLVYAFWYAEANTRDHTSVALLFLVIWWSLFAGLDLYRTLRASSANLMLQRLIESLNAVCIFLAIMSLSEAAFPDWTAAVTLALCLAYGVLFLIVVRRSDDLRAETTYAITAMLLLVISTAIQFDDFVRVVFWSLEALALFWAGVYVRRSFLWKAALGLLGLATLTLITINSGLWYESASLFTPILTARTGAFWALAGTLLLCGFLIRNTATGTEQKRHHALQIVGFVVLFVWTIVEMNDYFRLQIQSATGDHLDALYNMQQLAVSGVWLMDAVIIMALGMWQRTQVIRITAMVFFGCAVLKMFVYDLSFLDTLYRIVSFIGLGVILMLVSYVYHRRGVGGG